MPLSPTVLQLLIFIEYRLTSCLKTKRHSVKFCAPQCQLQIFRISVLLLCHFSTEGWSPLSSAAPRRVPCIPTPHTSHQWPNSAVAQLVWCSHPDNYQLLLTRRTHHWLSSILNSIVATPRMRLQACHSMLLKSWCWTCSRDRLSLCCDMQVNSQWELRLCIR